MVNDNPINMADMKVFLTGKLYQNLTEIHDKLEQESNAMIATEVVVSALGVNLGHILGQLDPKTRKSYMRDVTKLIKAQVTEISKFEDIETYGRIGHA